MAKVIKGNGWPICVSPNVVSPEFTPEQTWALVLTLTFCNVDGIWITNFEDVKHTILERYGKDRYDVWYDHFLDFWRKRYIVMIPSQKWGELYSVLWNPHSDRLVELRFNQVGEDRNLWGGIPFAEDWSEELIEKLDLGFVEGVAYANEKLSYVISRIEKYQASQEAK